MNNQKNINSGISALKHFTQAVILQQIGSRRLAKFFGDFSDNLKAADPGPFEPAQNFDFLQWFHTTLPGSHQHLQPTVRAPLDPFVSNRWRLHERWTDSRRTRPKVNAR